MKTRNVRYRQWERYWRYLTRLSDDIIATPGLERHYNRIVRKYNRKQRRSAE